MGRKLPVIPLALTAASLAAAFLVFLYYAGSARLRQAEAALAGRNYSLAADSYEAAAHWMFWRADLWERAALSALLAEQPEETLRLLEGREPLSQTGRLARAQARVQLGEFDEALKEYQSILADFGASAELYEGLAQVYRARGDWNAERAALQNVIVLAPDDAASHYRLALLLTLSDTGAALEQLGLAASLDPGLETAARTLRTCLNLSALESDESRRLTLVGRGLGLVEEWQLARDVFQRAVEADQSNAEAWAWLGEAEQHTGGDGLDELDQAAHLDRRSAVVRGLRGLYWKRAGDDRSALDEYMAAAELEPDNPAWKTALGETYARLGDLVSALTVYQQATQLASQDATQWRLLAAFCAEYDVQVQETGLPAAQKAVELASEDALALDTLGWVQLKSDLYYSAEHSLLAALKLDPDLASAHWHLALTYMTTGNREAAHLHLSRVLELDPGGAYGQQAEQVMKQYFP